MSGVPSSESSTTDRNLPPTLGADGPGLTSTMDYRADPRGRYAVTRLHATGGIGYVWLAYDDQLGREVALKELRPERAGDPVYARRFFEEARITGRLDHPGVVPVYELVRPADQPPFYTMRFVRGRTLREAATAYDQRRRAGTAEPLELRQLLAAVIAVCQAVAYAHTRGVLHRDLKGQNVVLGDYGEVIVLDWGLAKLVGSPAGAGQPERATAADTAGPQDATLPGQALGTPAYMAPEQAEGRLDLIDARTDIYGLGALLFEVLTGRPPHEGKDTEEVLRKIAVEETPHARAAESSVAPALDAICARAMAKAREDRYAQAGDVADDLQRWLADEPVSAYPEPWAARSRRWMKRHRPLVAGTSAALLVAGIALAVTTLLLARANRELVDANARERLAAHQAEVSAAEAQLQEGRARDQKARAEVSYRLARAGLDEAMKLRHDPRFQQGALEDVRHKLLLAEATFYQKFVQQRSEDAAFQQERGNALFRLGNLSDELGSKEDAIRHFQEARAVYEELARNDPASAPLADAIAECWNNLGNQYVATGRLREAEEAHQKAQAAWDKLTRAQPDNVAFQDNLARSYHNQAIVCRDTGRSRQAEDLDEKAIALRERLVKGHPGDAELQAELAHSYFSLGVLYCTTDRYRDAFATLGKARALWERLVHDHPGEAAYQVGLASSLNSLGIADMDTHQWREAEDVLKRSAALKEELTAKHPLVTSYQRDLANTWNSLGMLYYSRHRPKESQTAYERVLAVEERLVREQPSVTDYAVTLAGTYCNLGNLLRDQDQSATALTWYAKAIPILEGVLRKEARHTVARLFLRNTRLGRAEALGNLGRHAEAVKDWEATAELDDGRAVPFFRTQRALALARLGKHAQATAEAEAVTALGELPGALLYNLACVYALSAKAVRANNSADPPVPAAESGKRLDQYARHAMALLQQARQAGFFARAANVQNLRKDPDLDAVRSRDDFKKLVQELEKSLR